MCAEGVRCGRDGMAGSLKEEKRPVEGLSGAGRGGPQAGGGRGMQTPEPPGLSGELREGGRAEAPTPVDLEGPGGAWRAFGSWSLTPLAAPKSVQLNGVWGSSAGGEGAGREQAGPAGGRQRDRDRDSAVLEQRAPSIPPSCRRPSLGEEPQKVGTDTPTGPTTELAKGKTEGSQSWNPPRRLASRP